MFGLGHFIFLNLKSNCVSQAFGCRTVSLLIHCLIVICPCRSWQMDYGRKRVRHSQFQCIVLFICNRALDHAPSFDEGLESAKKPNLQSQQLAVCIVIKVGLVELFSYVVTCVTFDDVLYEYRTTRVPVLPF